MTDTKAEIARVEKVIAETKSPYLKKDYESTLKIETAESVLDVIDHKNYKHHAYIKMGNDINNEVECIFLWRIHTNLV